MPAKHAKWVPLLGDELARRVVKLGVDDPAAWCRDVVRQAVARAEGRRSEPTPTTREQAKCPHPEKDRQYGRCRRCGTRGLPEIAKTTGGKT